MRYTEVKLSKISKELTDDLEKETVKMNPNFDNSLKEPEIMPGKLPNLLLLGESEPQVKFYALEQEVGYDSPPFRFDNEGNDPIIPKREPSATLFDKNRSVKENLLLEKKNAYKQIKYVRGLLKQMTTLSKLIIKD